MKVNTETSRWVCYHEYSTVKSVISVWHGSLTLNWHCKCHLVISSRRLEPSYRTLIGCLSACPRHRDAAHRWTTETASSLGVVRVRQCTAERKSTEPYTWWQLYFLLDAPLDRQPVKGLSSDLALTHLRWWHMTGEVVLSSLQLLDDWKQERHTAASCSSRIVTRWCCRQWSVSFQ